MAENSNAQDKREKQDKVKLEMLKKDGKLLLKALQKGHMVAVLSKNEIMYVFAFREAYECFIHAFDAEEGRHKSFPINERNTAMMKHLDSAADQLFEITPRPDMDPIGVMVAAEQGIISYLDATGQLPVEDMDFMSWQEGSDADNSEGG